MTPARRPQTQREVAAIVRADLESTSLLDDLEEITSVEAAVIQEDVSVDETWDKEPVTTRMPDAQSLLLQEKERALANMEERWPRKK